MNKELFIEAIEAIQKQSQLDDEVSKHLGKAFPDAFEASLLPKNHFLQNALLHVLQVEMNDLEGIESGVSWIEYFCWELNFGDKNHLLKVYSKGREISMSTAGELYDFLNNRCQPLCDEQTVSYIEGSCEVIGNIYENPELIK